MRWQRRFRGLCAGALALLLTSTAWSADELLLVSGRWDNTLLVIDLGKAMWILDVPARKVVGGVTGVGNETYLLALLPGRP